MRRERWRKWLCLALLAALLTAWSGLSGAESWQKLKFGSNGPKVVLLQQTLARLGYYSGALDGKYGRGTEAAVRNYQAAHGLQADGVAGQKTQSLLYSQGTAAEAVPAAPQTASVPDAEVNAVSDGWFNGNYATLAQGSRGERVYRLQAALVRLGWASDTGGSYTAATAASVRAFQRAQGLTADGKAGWRTLQRLERLLGAYNTDEEAQAAVAALPGRTTAQAAAPAATAAPAVTAAPAQAGTLTQPAGTLRPGDRGSGVISLQTRLKALGYYSGAVDGKYGSGTTAAVTAFQRRAGLTADGVAGKRTCARLYVDSAPAAAAVIQPTAAPVATAAPQPQQNTNIILSPGNQNAHVRALQEALQDLGYAVTVNGSYDSRTKTAVQAFQVRNRLYVDGVAGPKTLTLLYSGSALGPAPAEASSPQAVSSVNAPGVGQIQLLHWFNDVKPALKNRDKLLVYDPATGLSWTLQVLSRGRHCDAEPLTAEDTAAMVKAFGNRNTWDQKAVYVHLPDGRWSLASTHDMPHLSGNIKSNNFDGHLCVHFLRDMAEAEKNDPNYGVANQKTIRAKWKALTGQTVD